MATKQELRSEDTRKRILASARELFSSRGYDAVTLREIAKDAKCSHTTIYIYFKDKEALLHELSMPSLEGLMGQMEHVMLRNLSSEDKLKEISLAFIQFCLANRSTYGIFFNVKSVRVDELEPELQINKARNALFGRLTEAVRECLNLEPNDNHLLMFSRIYYFTLHGIIATYLLSEESAKQLMERLTVTFAEAFAVLLAGFKHKIQA